MDHSLRVGEGTATRRLSGSDTISFCFHAQGARNVQSHHAMPSRPVSPHFALFFYCVFVYFRLLSAAVFIRKITAARQVTDVSDTSKQIGIS